jgi:hypothetical protein
MIVPLLAFTFMQITGTDFQTTLPIMLLVMLLMQNQTFIREHTSRAAINHVVSSSSPFGPITKELTTSFENPYNNPLVGAPASFNMGLEKASVNDVFAKGLNDDLMHVYSPLDEIDLTDRAFLQMPDPTLMDFRGVVVDSPLPNEGLIRERDFMGATASNKIHGPSGVGWDLNSQ